MTKYYNFQVLFQLRFDVCMAVVQSITKNKSYDTEKNTFLLVWRPA